METETDVEISGALGATALCLTLFASDQSLNFRTRLMFASLVVFARMDLTVPPGLGELREDAERMACTEARLFNAVRATKSVVDRRNRDHYIIKCPKSQNCHAHIQLPQVVISLNPAISADNIPLLGDIPRRTKHTRRNQRIEIPPQPRPIPGIFGIN
jgi:hypothetical protein